MFIAVPVKTLKTFARLSEADADKPFFEEFLCGRSQGQLKRVLIQRNEDPDKFVIVWVGLK